MTGRPEQAPGEPGLILRARDLTAHHRGRTALQHVDLTLRRGEAVALVGLNGAGKTTLLHVLAGLQPHTGQVTLVRQHCHHALRAAPVALVPQRSAARWDLPVTVLEAVLTGRHRFRRRWRRYAPSDLAAARTALHRLDVADLHRRQVGELSGGQAQRVLLARALAQQPELLLLDEPLAGLDGPAAAALVRTLLDLPDGGLSVLCALHELDVARSAFPRTVALAGGRVVGDGRSGQVLSPLGLERLHRLTPARTRA